MADRARHHRQLLVRLGLLRRFTRADDGAAAIEFAFVAIPFLILVFAIIELGLTFLVSMSLENAMSNVDRTIRTGALQARGGDAASYHQAVCDEMSWLGSSCGTALTLDDHPGDVGLPLKLEVRHGRDERWSIAGIQMAFDERHAGIGANVNLVTQMRLATIMDRLQLDRRLDLRTICDRDRKASVRKSRIEMTDSIVVTPCGKRQRSVGKARLEVDHAYAGRHNAVLGA